MYERWDIERVDWFDWADMTTVISDILEGRDDRERKKGRREVGEKEEGGGIQN